MTIDRFFSSPLVARCALNVVLFLAVVVVLTLGFAANRRAEQPTYIDRCALVLDQSGSHCR